MTAAPFRDEGVSVKKPLTPGAYLYNDALLIMLGDRPMAGLRTLTPSIQVRILVPQPR